MVDLQRKYFEEFYFSPSKAQILNLRIKTFRFDFRHSGTINHGIGIVSMEIAQLTKIMTKHVNLYMMLTYLFIYFLKKSNNL